MPCASSSAAFTSGFPGVVALSSTSGAFPLLTRRFFSTLTNVVRFGDGHVRDGGSITLLSDLPGGTFPNGLSALSSVGGAVEALGRTVAKEVAPRIQVNVVSPGLIDTPMHGQTAQAKRAEDFSDMSKGNLIPRAGTADDVAEGVMFVIKHDFVTAKIVDIDGGSVLS